MFVRFDRPESAFRSGRDNGPQNRKAGSFSEMSDRTSSGPLVWIGTLNRSELSQSVSHSHSLPKSELETESEEAAAVLVPLRPRNQLVSPSAAPIQQPPPLLST
jgi:hypothetical protein